MVDFNPNVPGGLPPGFGSLGGAGSAASTSGTDTVDMPTGPTQLANGGQLTITVEPNSETDHVPRADHLASFLLA